MNVQISGRVRTETLELVLRYMEGTGGKVRSVSELLRGALEVLGDAIEEQGEMERLEGREARNALEEWLGRELEGTVREKKLIPRRRTGGKERRRDRGLEEQGTTKQEESERIAREFIRDWKRKEETTNGLRAMLKETGGDSGVLDEG